MTSIRKPERCKLYCLPYAGGSSVIYHPWKKALRDDIELIPVELAGRGKRIMESAYQNLEAAVDDVFEMLAPELEQSPYMLFGHSMGAMIAYELAQKIRDRQLPMPAHLFFSGKGAMHIERPDEKKYHLFDDDKFKREVISMGGTSPELFEHPELMELFIPLLKNDFRVAETYQLDGPIRKFDQDITVLLGQADDLSDAQRKEWAQHTTRTCHFHSFSGGHFFINDEQENILKIIRDVVEQNALS